MDVQIADHEPAHSPSVTERVGFEWLRAAVAAAETVLVIYLCWRIVIPFIPALCWAFAVTLIAEPIHQWLLRRGLQRTPAAMSVIILVATIVIGPGIVLVGSLAREASDIVHRAASDAGTKNLREAIENSGVAGPVFQWLDSRYDLPKETMLMARSVAGWASAAASSVLAGSMWVLTQVAVAIFVLFYFLRDGQAILGVVRPLIPLPELETDLLFGRIAQTIRAWLGGKIIVAGIPGTLGGIMFNW